MGSRRGRNRGGEGRVSRLLNALSLACLISPAVQATPFDCHSDACALPGDGPFTNLVVGTVARVADDAEAQRVFTWAREHGYWASLEPDPQRFVQAIQMMSIEIPDPQGGREITLLMGREHYDAIKIAAGDLVRYVPHPSGHAAPELKDPAADSYWKLFGCIAVLCRAEDRSCPSRYAPGVYRLSDGVQLGTDLRSPLVGGVRVDTGTYLPMRALDR